MQYPTIPDILRAVSARFGVTTIDLLSHRRAAARPRQIAYWAARHCTLLTLPQIGRAMNRDFTTVRHGVRTIDAIVAAGGPVADAATAILHTLTRRLAA